MSGEKCTKDGSHRIFYNIILEMTSHPFFCILLVTKTNCGSVGGDYTRCEHQGVEIVVAYRGGWLAPYFTKRKKKRRRKKPLLYLEVHNEAIELDLFFHLQKA